jgi:hypothetical protein
VLAGAARHHPSLRAAFKSEPLSTLFKVEHEIWKDALKAAAQYRVKEASEHSHKLQAYVEAAAARAGRQLEPGLRKELYGALGLPQ